MTAILVFAVWALIGQMIAIANSRYHWQAFYVLSATLIPILWLLYQAHNWPAVAIALIAAASVFRWPLWFAVRWLGRQLGLWQRKE
ncbi:putative integral membrane protein [Rubricella aquisinus]|uniref:Putative integral membrane protein n=1 Tax=Rubricella aquisinus TaxID=2028108 RepID=A0A840WLX3_9RHOB|nr:DUF2484 family protein [Rubricella aquisinus]MBB5516059.1 putative integral membrane protein [Rubricella aquisinus]